MPSIALSDSELYLLSLGGGGPIPPSVAEKAAKLLARPAGTSKLPVPGSKGHERCVHHEPLSLPMIRATVLCFTDAKVPSAKVIAERVKWAQWTSAQLVARHKAFLARPAGDGKFDGLNGKRIAPAQLRREQATKRGGHTPIYQHDESVWANPKGEKLRIPRSKLDPKVTRRRSRKVVMRVYMHREAKPTEAA